MSRSCCRVFSLAQLEGRAAVFSEPLPDLTAARKLQFFGAYGQRFSGTVIVPASLRVVDISRNRCSNVTLASGAAAPHQLAAALTSRNPMMLNLTNLAGQLGQLVVWHAARNRVRKLPPMWASQRLHALELSVSELAVRTVG